MRKRALSVLIALSMCLLTSSPALAEGPVTEPVPSDPLVLDGIQNPRVCSFPIRLDAVRNNATIKTFPNGRVLVSGSFWTRVTNLSTGNSIAFNNSGPITVTPRSDGSVQVTARGQSLFYFFAGDLGGPGLLRMTGLVEETISAEGVITSFSHTGGTTENLCATL
jgi:hypothetical protein